MVQNAINAKDCFIQIVTAEVQTLVTCATSIPFDDTIPQNTEGNQVLTATITPVFSTSNLLILFNGVISTPGLVGSTSIALFQDSNANALAAQSYPTSNCVFIGRLVYVMTSGTTSSTTFNIRVGGTGGAAKINSNAAGTQIYGGVAATTLTIIEYL